MLNLLINLLKKGIKNLFQFNGGHFKQKNLGVS